MIVSKKWIWNKLMPTFLYILAIGGSIIYGNKKRASLNENAAFTIGVTVKTYWTAASGEWIIYSYTVEGIKYTGNSRYNEKTVVPEGRYFVKFNRKDYEVSNLLQNHIVPDSIKTAPFEGWEKIP